ncbi:MAG: phytanoyl-CoA dioxygenase family protein [Candidatus Latescibacteria bacterium]|jgi:ectoine hydroxylase-related dioxygenase (phytanoyl-CoA dioxygenase family)|nr:phytanoyl-CoA dioxygenase family protein [Candidatus Latescibacterota bacterium]MDP7448766.1 phytanoyl-CoA dioxygenase family protein [Candidatus Latescibacterota bacterium]HJP32034.1 phytanoyl-CoA dioxygenase family protein [Candidatus Latescibacterota bacterium]
MKLTTDDVSAFYEQGFVVLRQVFEAADIAEMSAACDRLKEMAQPLSGSVMHEGANFVVDQAQVDGRQVARIRRISWCGGADQTLLDYGADRRLLAMAATLLGSDEMNQLINQVHYKEPGDTVQFPLHQDSTHRGHGTDGWEDVNGRGSYVQTATLIDPMTAENGPLIFVPGSYRQGHLGLPHSLEEWPEHIDLGGAVTITGDPGDVVVFGPYTLHGSRPNLSTLSRRVFINGYAYPGASRRQYRGAGAGRLLRLTDHED